MRIDTHLHPIASKVGKPNWDQIKFMFTVAAESELDVVCLTEHLDAQYFSEMIRAVFIEKKLAGQSLSPSLFLLENGILLSSGAEVAIKGGGDIGVHAEPDVLLGLNPVKGFYSVLELLDALDKTGKSYITVAHHLYCEGKFIENIENCMDRIHAIELPAKDLKNRRKYEEIANRYNMPMTGSTDSHTWVQVGSCYTDVDMNGTEFSLPTFLNAIISNKIKPIPSPEAERLVRISNLYRKTLEVAA